jgi:hypothetical protein
LPPTAADEITSRRDRTDFGNASAAIIGIMLLMPHAEVLRERAAHVTAKA